MSLNLPIFGVLKKFFFLSGRPGTHSSLPTEGGLRLSRPGCLVLRRVGLPVCV